MSSEKKVKNIPEQETEFLGDDIEIDENEAEGQFSEDYEKELDLKAADLDLSDNDYDDSEDDDTEDAENADGLESSGRAKASDNAESSETSDSSESTALTKEEKAARRQAEKEHLKITKDWDQKEILSDSDEPGYIRRSPISSWFSTLMIMNLPIIGWIYLLVLALRKNGDQRKDFARAYLVYKLVFFLAALLLILIIMYCSMGLLDQLLSYVNML